MTNVLQYSDGTTTACLLELIQESLPFLTRREIPEQARKNCCTLSAGKMMPACRVQQLTVSGQVRPDYSATQRTDLP
jgi:hypothetical protein